MSYNIIQVLIIIFATTNGLVTLYTLISSLLIYLGKRELSGSGEFSRLVNSLFIMVFIGFIYAAWNLLIQLKILKLGNIQIQDLVSNFLVILLFVSMSYTAFLTRYLSKRFGFKRKAEQINKRMKEIKLKAGR